MTHLFFALRLSLIVVACSMVPVTAATQEPRGGYVRFSIGSNWLQTPTTRGVFQIDPVPQPSIALGFTLKSRHSIEANWARVEAESVDQRPCDMCLFRERIRVTATSLGIGYRYGFPSPHERLRPSAHLRLMRWSVENMTDTDTQPEFYRSAAYGIGPGLGLAMHLFKDAWATVRGEYRWSTDTEAPRSRIGLNGPQVEVGLELGF